MKVIKEITNINDLNLWEGAVETRNKIVEAGKGEECMNLLEDLYPDGVDETDLNDYFWFDDEDLLGLLEIPVEDEEEEFNDDEEADIELEEDDYEFMDSDNQRVKISKDVFDDFDRNSFIRIKFLDEVDPVSLYQMYDEDGNWIYCESMK